MCKNSKHYRTVHKWVYSRFASAYVARSLAWIYKLSYTVYLAKIKLVTFFSNPYVVRIGIYNNYENRRAIINPITMDISQIANDMNIC